MCVCVIMTEFVCVFVFLQIRACMHVCVHACVCVCVLLRHRVNMSCYWRTPDSQQSPCFSSSLPYNPSSCFETDPLDEVFSLNRAPGVDTLSILNYTRPSGQALGETHETVSGRVEGGLWLTC